MPMMAPKIDNTINTPKAGASLQRSRHFMSYFLFSSYSTLVCLAAWFSLRLCCTSSAIPSKRPGWASTFGPGLLPFACLAAWFSSRRRCMSSAMPSKRPGCGSFVPRSSASVVDDIIPARTNTATLVINIINIFPWLGVALTTSPWESSLPPECSALLAL